MARRKRKVTDEASAEAVTPEVEPAGMVDETVVQAPPALVQHARKPSPRAVRVAVGRAITCKRGVLGPGAAIEARDVVGGEETIARLLAAGALVEG